MSTTPINHKIAEALHFEIESFTKELKGSKWKISEENLGTHIVDNALDQTRLLTLSQLCINTFGNDEAVLRLQDKVTTSSNIIGGLCHSSLEDPRLRDLPNRIARLNDPNCLHKPRKMEKYGNYLSMITKCDQIPFSIILPLQIQLKRATRELESPFMQPPVSHPGDEASPIFSLQSAINCLDLQPKEGFGKALDRILWLEDLTFTTCTKEKEQIANRIFFHLERIHPQKQGQNEAHYGSKAFLSEDMSTHKERRRAIQRTQVEVCLFALEKYLKGDRSIQSPVANEPAINGIFKILEDLTMDPKDMPQGHNNIAHALFGTMYANYLAAWENNQSMIHPHDPAFTDFGRNSFMGNSHSLVKNEYKLQAIKVISASLWAAWNP